MQIGYIQTAREILHPVVKNPHREDGLWEIIDKAGVTEQVALGWLNVLPGGTLAFQPVDAREMTVLGERAKSAQAEEERKARPAKAKTAA